VVRQRDLLGASLALITDPASEATLRQELATLANKVLVADGLDTDDPTNLLRAADKAAAMINLGLDLFSGDDATRGAETLRQVYLENLFRLGHGETATISNRLNDIIDNKLVPLWPEGMNILDEPWLESVDLLNARTPIIQRPQSNGPTEEDFIRSSSDLERTRAILQVIEVLPALLAACKGQCRQEWEQLEADLYRKGLIHSLSDVTIGNLLLTGVANEIWTGSFEITPLPLSMWGEIAPLLAPETVEKTLLARLKEMTAGNTTSGVVYLRPILDRYREEMGHRSELPDPRLLPFFLFTEADR